MLSPSAMITLISCGFSSYTVLAGCVSGGRAGQLNLTPWTAARATRRGSRSLRSPAISSCTDLRRARVRRAGLVFQRLRNQRQRGVVMCAHAHTLYSVHISWRSSSHGSRGSAPSAQLAVVHSLQLPLPHLCPHLRRDFSRGAARLAPARQMVLSGSCEPSLSLSTLARCLSVGRAEHGLLLSLSPGQLHTEPRVWKTSTN